MPTVSSLSEAVKNNFLDLDGGVMRGAISMDEIVSMKHSSDGSYMQIDGGSFWGKGASLELFGKDHSGKGKFLLWAHDGTNYSVLEGFSDGLMTWGNKHVVCVESYKSGTSWYRKYSDGWIEQGGSASTSTTVNATTTKITFTTPFTSTINVLGGFVKAKHNATYGQLWFQSGDATLTGFVGSVVAYESNGNANHATSGGTCYWYASGY